MGWTFVHKGRGGKIKEFLSTEMNWESGGTKVTVLDCAVVAMRTAYLAVETIREDVRKVVGVVVLLDYRPQDYYNFGYKVMDEASHPYYYDCPARILDLLTDTDNENALSWRATCREKLNKQASRPKLYSGAYIVFERSITFSNGEALTDFYVMNAKKRMYTKGKGFYGQYKLPKSVFEDRAYRVMSEDEYISYKLKAKR